MTGFSSPQVPQQVWHAVRQETLDFLIKLCCTQTTDPIQLRNFSNRLLKEDIPARKYVSEFADWEKAFRAVLDLPYGNSKKLLVIDEFPYMCKGNSSIPSVLQNLWDAEFRDSNVMIILCGSAMSFIEKELLAEKNPLYGRATGIYKMNAKNYMVGECKFKKAPFSYSEYLDTTAKLMVLFFLSDPNPLRWALSRFLLCPQN